jgi:hypothetical protein
MLYKLYSLYPVIRDIVNRSLSILYYSISGKFKISNLLFWDNIIKKSNYTLELLFKDSISFLTASNRSS